MENQTSSLIHTEMREFIQDPVEDQGIGQRIRSLQRVHYSFLSAIEAALLFGAVEILLFQYILAFFLFRDKSA